MATPQKLPSGAYRVRYTDPDGRRRSETFTTLKAARAFDADIRAKIGRGAWTRPEDGQRPFGDWAEKWFAHNHPARRRTTRSWDLSLYRHHVKPRWADVELGSITREEIRDWVSELSDPRFHQVLRWDAATKGLVPDGGPLSPRTIQQVYAVFAKIVRGAVEDRLLEDSPLPSRISLPAARRKTERYLTHPEIVQLADAHPEIYQPLIYLCCYGGLRIGEAAALRVGDIDWERKQVRVLRTQTDVGGVIAYDAPKTDAGNRTVGLPDQVVDMLRAHVGQWGSGDDSHVFFSPTGKDLRVRTWRRRVFDPAVEASGLERLTPHDMRHTAAAILISSGANQWELARTLGHRDTRMIDRVYGHLFHADRERVRASLTERFADAERVATILPLRRRA